MIILDTHIWVWWNQGDKKLAVNQRELINESQENGIGVCTISLLEIARLVACLRDASSPLSYELTQNLSLKSTGEFTLAESISRPWQGTSHYRAIISGYWLKLYKKL